MAFTGIISTDLQPTSPIQASRHYNETFVAPKHKKNRSNRPGPLSPLHLTYNTLNNSNFSGLHIGLISLNKRNSIDNNIIKHSSALQETFLSKHYNFSENKRLTNKLDFSRIKKNARLGERNMEKYAIISKDQRYAGRNPEKNKLMKGIIPATRAKYINAANGNSIRLTINGIIKSFSPRALNS
jgi:hypothetical protein